MSHDPTHTPREDATRIQVGTVGTTLSLAVEVVDGHAAGPPVTTPEVTLADRPEPVHTTPSGYHVVTDLPAAVEDVDVRVDAGSAYLPETHPVDLTTLDARNPLVTVTLVPAPAYPFGRGETLVRGRVVDADGDPLPDSTVSVDDRPETTRCDHRGEFVLPLAVGSKDELRTTPDGRRVVDVDGDDPLLRAATPTGTETTGRVEVELGTTVSTTLSF